jgi:8-oxo-dGTP pyrophosphatase MutT (NUDIX family)
MKDRIKKQDGSEYELEWIEDTNFDILPFIRQVYVFIFSKEGKLVIVNPASTWRLPGGKPDSDNEKPEETLIRETLEEADITVKKINPLGYIKATKLNKDKKTEFLLRYVAEVDKINPQTQDPAIGVVNERLFIDPKDFLKYCDWRKFGNYIKERAIKKWSETKRS